MDTRFPSLMRIIQLYVVIASSALCGLASPTLKLVNVLYRHGDRSPAVIYPLDINQVPGAWPDGRGWLTDIGKQQQFELGQWIGQRYKGFLNTTRYTNSEILIQASGVERCLMSAYCNLAGLYPPHGDQVWNKDIPWQPIPVQTTPILTDNKLAEQAPCPRYDQLMDQELHSDAIKKEEKDNKAFYDMIIKETGVVKESIRDIWMVGDAIICEKAHNMTLNPWVTDQVWEKLNKLRTESFDLLFGLPEMAKLKGGPLLAEILSNMEGVVNVTKPSPKFFMYSAHDTTVASLLSAMQVFDQHQPMYRALIMVELYEDGGDHFVKILYRNSTTQPPVELHPPGCEKPLCKLETFSTVAHERIPVDWEKECQLQNSSSMQVSPASWIALVVGLCLACVVCLTLSVMVVRLRAKRMALYSKI